MIFNTAYAAIGNVVQYEGIASVERDEEKVSLEKDSDIFFKDNVLTGNGNVGIFGGRICQWVPKGYSP